MEFLLYSLSTLAYPTQTWSNHADERNLKLSNCLNAERVTRQPKNMKRTTKNNI